MEQRVFIFWTEYNTESLRVATYASPAISRLVSRFSNWRSAITPVHNDQFAQLTLDAYARLAGPMKPQATTDSAARYSDADKTLPDRIPTAIQRIVRDTAKGRELKFHYGHECQICGMSIRLPARDAHYVEVHHLCPLGQPFGGNDDWNNMIIVCPNCHTAFDYGSYRIHPETLRVHAPNGERKIKFIEPHRLSRRNLQRHWRLSGPTAS